jgi:hypothetical protein
MKLINKVLFLFIFVSFSNSICAQNRTPRFSEITKKEKAKIKKEAVKNIKNLGYYLKKLAQAKDNITKNAFITTISKKFVDSAKIETASLKGKKLVLTSPKGGYAIKHYLRTIIPRYRSTAFSFINIEFVSFNIGDLKPLRGKLNTYYFDYKYIQRFEKGSKKKSKNKDLEFDLRYSYRDETEKSGRIIVKKKNTILGTKWVLFFGSIKVENVKII